MAEIIQIEKNGELQYPITKPECVIDENGVSVSDLITDKQDVISDLDTIRSNASKGATALQSVPAEYVTETELTNKGYATTSAMNTALGNKVDKVSGKQLSTEDFTTALKNKLNGLNNYDDTTISNAVNKLRSDFDTLVSGDTTTAIKTFNEVIAFLNGISDSEDLDSIIASIEQQIGAKQDKITDLATIRSGAALGATALQSYTEKYTGTYSKPSGGIPKTDLTVAIQESLNKADTALQSHQDISGKADKASLSAVATSGSYNDLADKPYHPDNNAPLPIESGGTGANNKEDACTNLGAAKQYYIQKGLSKEGWYRIGLLTAVMSTSSARIVVGGTNADVSPIIMDFQHNFRGDMLSQMPTVMTPLYVTKVRAVKKTSDDVYVDLYFTNISSSITTVSVFPLEGTWESMNFVDVTSSAGGTVATQIDIVKDGFLDGKVNSSDLAAVATSGSYDDLSNKPTIPSAVTESTVSGWGFTKNAGTVTGIKINGSTKSPSSGVIDLGTLITSQQDISGKLDKTEAASTYLTKTDAASTYLGKTAKATSATSADSATKATQDASGNVITSTYATKTELSAKGTYSKPSGGIPKTDLASEIQTSLGKADTALQSYTEKYTGTYSKPSGGIPKSDLASAVQTSLGKADTALQSYTETDPVFSASAAAGIKSSDITNWNSKTSNTGTITGIKMNGASKGTSGVVDLGTVITAHQDISGKVDKVSGKGLSTNDYTTDEKNKLGGIAAGAEVNVQSDWNVTDTTSDAYIKNKPTIPTAVTESTVSGWGFTKNTGTYSKPSTGIPKTDLASAVQTSLGKADTALQSHQDISGKINGDGTITKIVKVSSLPSSPNANTLYVIV